MRYIARILLYAKSFGNLISLKPGSYQGGEMMMKSVFWWRKPEYPEDISKPALWNINNV